MPAIALSPEHGQLLLALVEVLEREGKLPNARAPVSPARRRRQVAARALRVAARAHAIQALRRAARPPRGTEPEHELAVAQVLVAALNGLFPRQEPQAYRVSGFHLERWEPRRGRYVPYTGD